MTNRIIVKILVTSKVLSNGMNMQRISKYKLQVGVKIAVLVHLMIKVMMRASFYLNPRKLIFLIITKKMKLNH
jgi:hypothetical protein